MRKVLKALLVLLAVYALLFAGFFIAMRQRPEVFSKIMAKAPTPVFLIFPFKPMWLYARSGSLEVGDEAPDFSLETYDKQSRVQLSALSGEKPVVLVFGSYT